MLIAVVSILGRVERKEGVEVTVELVKSRKDSSLKEEEEGERRGRIRSRELCSKIRAHHHMWIRKVNVQSGGRPVAPQISNFVIHPSIIRKYRTTPLS